MEFLKLFQTHQDYEAFVSGDTMVKPNVSHCIEENEVHYSPIVIMTVRYNVTDASNPTQLYFYYAEEGEEDYWIRGVDMFTNVEIDGVDVPIADLDASSGQTQLSVGEHTVKYTLKDPTFHGSFSGCVSLTSATIPNSVYTIINNAFANCGLTSVGPVGSGSDIELPNSITSIGSGAFNTCSSLTSVTIPNSVTSIGLFAFNDCRSLTNIVIPNSVTTIGSSAFNTCSSLTSVTIPNSVTTIGDSAFYHCNGLRSITMGNSVMDVGFGVFAECGLTNITSLAMTAPTIKDTTFRGAKTNGTLYVPIGSTGYDVWMGTGNYYLGKYGWTKVEQ